MKLQLNCMEMEERIMNDDDQEIAGDKHRAEEHLNPGDESENLEIDALTTDSVTSARTGKRPRIRKPLFSLNFPKQ